MAKDPKNQEDDEEQLIEQMIEEEGQEQIQNEEQLPEESKIGKTLSDVTTKTVIIMVLVVMLSIPLFSFNTYADETTSFQIGLDYIALYNSDPNGTSFQISYDSYYTRHKDIDTPLVFLVAGYNTYNDENIPEGFLRYDEQQNVYPTDESLNLTYVSIFDMRFNTHLDALLSIIQTIFVCIVLTVGAIIFTKDANDYVIGPIEQMMIKVQRIAKNPLEAAKEEENEAVALHRMEKEEYERSKNSCCKVFSLLNI